MHNVGILQGRVLPKDREILQVFPEQWKEEFSRIKEIGFGIVELLDDKENCLRDILSKGENIFARIVESGLVARSVCADQLCMYSLLEDEPLFSQKLEALITMLRKKDFIFVIPFFNENMLETRKALAQALHKLSRYDEILGREDMRFALEIDLPSSMIEQEFKKVSLKHIGVCYDLGNNIEHGADLKKDIKLLGNRINHVHIKDKVENKNVRIRKDLENIKGAFRALQEIGYPGMMILETCITPEPVHEAETNLATVQEYLAV